VIRLRRPACPASLAKRGRAAAPSTTTFDRRIYGAKAVKSALLGAQHEKCAFCEAKTSHVTHGDVEHFRPKAGWKQDPGDRLRTPGYHWLAYAWENLLFSCQICNQRKANQFPLKDPKARAATPEDVDHEKPLLIDPFTEDPAEHLAFNGAFVRPLTERGRITTDVLGLDRKALVDRRRQRLDLLKHLRKLQDVYEATDPGHPDLPEIRSILEHALTDDGEYAGMARAALR
jgi:uncharacterized protein (TIGR02646 family)